MYAGPEWVVERPSRQISNARAFITGPGRSTTPSPQPTRIRAASTPRRHRTRRNRRHHQHPQPACDRADDAHGTRWDEGVASTHLASMLSRCGHIPLSVRKQFRHFPEVVRALRRGCRKIGSERETEADPGVVHVFEHGGETLPPVALRLAEPPRVRHGSIRRRTLEVGQDSYRVGRDAADVLSVTSGIIWAYDRHRETRGLRAGLAP